MCGSCSVVGCLSVAVGCVLQDVVEVVAVLVEEEVVDILLAVVVAGCFFVSLLSC